MLNVILYESSTKSRYEVVDSLVRKWLLKYGGDPSQYKKQTRAFDALAALADRLIKQHVTAMEGAETTTLQVMKSLEEALKDVSDKKQPLHERLGPALAALLHTTQISDLATEETMTLLVNSLIDDEHPLSIEAINRIQITHVLDDIRDCGVGASLQELRSIVKMAIDCLRSQLVGPDEAKYLVAEVNKALSIDSSKI